MLQLSTLFFFKLMYLAIDILNLDYDVGVAFGVGEFIGGMILTLILLVAVTSLPIYKRAITPAVFLASMVLFISVALSWISIFVLILIVGLVAFGIVKTVNDFLREHGLR